MRSMIAALRLVALLCHLVLGLATGLLVFSWQTQRQRNPIIRAWSRALVTICGARLQVDRVALDSALAPGDRAGNGRLLLANHISWIDIFALHAVLPGRFVAKSEIRGWPVLGWLVSLSGTLYVERGRRHAVASINHRVASLLRAGEVVSVFPEGTTTDGTELLPFHSNLIAPAFEAGCDVWPVALRYSEAGAPSRAPAFVGDLGLVGSLWNILTARDLAVHVALLAPIGTVADRNRHHIAQAAQNAIAAHLGLASPQRRRRVEPDGISSPADPVADTADNPPGSPGAPAS